MYSLRCVSLLSACKTGFRKWTEKIKISLLTRELSDYRGLDVTSESEGAVMALDDAILELTGMRSSCFETVTKVYIYYIKRKYLLFFSFSLHM